MLKVNENGTSPFLLQGLKRRQDEVCKQCPDTVPVSSRRNSNQTIVILEYLFWADVSITQVQEAALTLSPTLTPS